MRTCSLPSEPVPTTATFSSDDMRELYGLNAQSSKFKNRTGACFDAWRLYVRFEFCEFYMVLATINQPKQLFLVTYIGRVRAEELAQSFENVVALVSQLSAGFTLVSDLSHVESIGVGCDREIGKIMELFDEKHIGLVIRVIPDPSKDIGLNIISFFHYTRPHRTITC